MLGSIVVLDDCEDLLELSRCFIEEICGRKVLTFSSMAAIQAAAEQVLACEKAILDINLGPEQPTGIDVYHWMRRRGFKGPIYFLTGHARNFPLVAEAEKLGDAKVFTKPLHPDDFAKLIRGEV